jgi:hypothetical protein
MDIKKFDDRGNVSLWKHLGIGLKTSKAFIVLKMMYALVK